MGIGEQGFKERLVANALALFHLFVLITGIIP